MIDYLLVVLLFAFVPIGIILMFIGCFYCFLFIQHCATYHEEDDEEANNSNDSNRSRRDGSTPTPSVVVTNCDTNFNRGGSGGSINSGSVTRPDRQRRGVSLSPALVSGRSKRLEGVDEFIAMNSNSGANFSKKTTTCSTADEEQPPPPYHSICFAKNKDENILTNNSSRDEDEDNDSLFRISTV